MNNQNEFVNYIKKIINKTSEDLYSWTKIGSNLFKTEDVAKPGKYTTSEKDNYTYTFTLSKSGPAKYSNNNTFVLTITNKKTKDIIIEFDTNEEELYLVYLDELFSLVEHTYEKRAIRILDELI